MMQRFSSTFDVTQATTAGVKGAAFTFQLRLPYKSLRGQMKSHRRRPAELASFAPLTLIEEKAADYYFFLAEQAMQVQAPYLRVPFPSML